MKKAFTHPTIVTCIWPWRRVRRFFKVKKAFTHPTIVTLSAALACLTPTCSSGQMPAGGSEHRTSSVPAPPAVPGAVEPPPLPARPVLPPPPADAVLPPPRTVVVKPPLSWRAKAVAEFSHAVQTAQSHSSIVPEAYPLSRTFSASLEDALLALIASCPAAGFSVEQVDSRSGLLIVTPEASHGTGKRIRIRLYEQSTGKTLVAADTTGLSAALRPAVVSLLQTIESTFPKKAE